MTFFFRKPMGSFGNDTDWRSSLSSRPVTALWEKLWYLGPLGPTFDWNRCKLIAMWKLRSFLRNLKICCFCLSVLCFKVRRGKKKEIGKKSGSYWVWSAINRWLFTWLEQNIQVEIDSRSSVAQLYFVYFLHNGLVFPESLREAASFHRQGTVLLPLPMEILNDTHLGTVRGCVRVAFLSHVQSCLSYQTHMGCVPSYSSLTFFHGKVIT